MTNQEKDGKYLLPFSIIVAALLIVGAVIYSAGLKNVERPATEKKQDLPAGRQEASAPSAPDIENVQPIGGKDHLRGNPDAPVKIIEFSDMECPFCKSLHQTMLRVMDEYGKDGKVAWIYRHYPIAQLHSKSEKSAEAAECAAELGGNDVFWKYLDRYFEITPSNNLIDLDELPKIAKNIGLDTVQFENCLNSGRHRQLIEGQIQDALDSGARGTPYSVLVGRDGKKYPISGALPMEDFKDQYGETQKGVKSLIEEALK